MMPLKELDRTIREMLQSGLTVDMVARKLKIPVAWVLDTKHSLEKR